MKRPIALLLCLGILWTQGGCESSGETPEEVTQEFLHHLYLREPERAWELVDPQDQAMIEQAQQGLKQAGVKEIPRAHELLLTRRVSSPYALKEATLVGEAVAKKGERAQVKLLFRDGRVEHAYLDHDGTAWRVRLSVGSPRKS